MKENYNNNVLILSEIKRKKNKSKNKKKYRKYLTLAIIFILFSIISFIIYNFIVSNNVKTKVAVNETIKDIITVEGVILREEQVINAPERGKFFPAVEANNRVREGQIIGNIVGINKKNVPVITSEAGLISFKIDNYEKLLNPGLLDKIDINKLKDMSKREIIISEGEEVFKGEPIARIVNNLKPILIAVFIDEQLNHVISKSNNYIKIVLPEENIYKGEILNVDVLKNMLILKVSQWDKQLVSERKRKFDLIINEYTGIVLPYDALVKMKNEKGVIIKEDNNFKWKKATITAELNNKVIVKNIETNAVIVLNPDKIKNKI
jgi:hypothetical protein